MTNNFNSPAVDESNLLKNNLLVHIIVTELAIYFDKWKG